MKQAVMKRKQILYKNELEKRRMSYPSMQEISLEPLVLNESVKEIILVK